MKRSVFQVTLVVILAGAFLAPPLSQALCSDGCVGGACEAPPTTALCDLDATGGCCGDAEQTDACPVTDPITPQLTDACQLCPCYEQTQIGDFIVPKGTGELKWAPSHVVAPGPAPVPVPSSARQFSVNPSDINAHSPPLYKLHRALLI
jgi:hypothetical protein